MPDKLIYQKLGLHVTAPVISYKNVDIFYKTGIREKCCLHNIIFDLAPHQTMGIVGESGSGKSTIGLSAVAALPPNASIKEGSVSLFGRNIESFSSKEKQLLRRHFVKIIEPDTGNQFDPLRTIGKQVKHYLQPGNIEKFSEYLLSWDFEEPAKILDSKPHVLTPLKRQRLSLALAFFVKPALIILDEPTQSLDVSSEADTFRLIRYHLDRQPVSLLFLSHHLGLVSSICRDISLMYAGEIIESGETTDIFKSTGHPYTQGLFQSIPMPGTDKTDKPLMPIKGALTHNKKDILSAGCSFFDRCPHAKHDICTSGYVNLEQGNKNNHYIRCRRWRDVSYSMDADSGTNMGVRDRVDIGPIVLSVTDVSKEYVKNEPLANDRVSFDVRRAETLAIVGETGSGKTTVAKLLLGIDVATNGSIRLAGREISDTYVCKRSQHQRQNLQAIFTESRWTLNPALTIGAQLKRTVEKFYDFTTETKQKEFVLSYFEKADLSPDIYNNKPYTLSDAQCQTLGILRAFMTNAKVIVADEPLHGLDASVQATLTALIGKLQSEQKTTLIYISSDISFVRYFADTVAIMYRGQIMAYGDVDKVFQPPLHPYTEALMAAVPVPDVTRNIENTLLRGEIFACTKEILTRSCPFHVRCHKSVENLCDRLLPPLQVRGRDQQMLCHLEPAELTAHIPG